MPDGWNLWTQWGEYGLIAGSLVGLILCFYYVIDLNLGVLTAEAKIRQFIGALLVFACSVAGNIIGNLCEIWFR